MTTEQAVKWLKDLNKGLAMPQYEDALDMAIQALTDNSCYSCKYYFHGRCKKANVTWSDITQCEFYEALQAQAEKTCDIEKSNFSKEQYKLDTDTAYECGYNAGLQAQADCNTCDKAVRDWVGVIGCAKFDSKPTVAIPSAEPYKGMTNGEVIRMLFKPQVKVKEYGLIEESYNFDGDWWNSPYKGVAIPSADKTGHWEWVQYDSNPNIGNWHCSECRTIIPHMPEETDNTPIYKWCPNCGADMRGEQDG